MKKNLANFPSIMVGIRDVINSRYLGKDFLENELANTGTSSEASDENAFPLDDNTRQLVNDFTQNEVSFDELEELPEKCRRDLYRNSQFWTKTEMLLLHLEEESFLTTQISDTSSKKETCLSDAESKHPQSSKDVGITQVWNFQSSPIFSANEVANTGSFAEFEEILGQIDESSESEIGNSSDHKVRTLAAKFRNLFHHLITNMVLPCDDQIRYLLKEILTIRRTEGELISLGSGASNEISTIKEGFEEPNGNLTYWQDRISRCCSSLTDMRGKFENIESQLIKLTSQFDQSITSIAQSIMKISHTRDRVLETYYSSYERNASHVIFGSKDFHEFTRVDEYKTRTLWHYHIDITEFQALITENFLTLVSSNGSLSAMIALIEENIRILRQRCPSNEIPGDQFLSTVPETAVDSPKLRLVKYNGSPTKKHRRRNHRTRNMKRKTLRQKRKQEARRSQTALMNNG